MKAIFIDSLGGTFIREVTEPKPEIKFPRHTRLRPIQNLALDHEIANIISTHDFYLECRSSNILVYMEK